LAPAARAFEHDPGVERERRLGMGLHLWGAHCDGAGLFRSRVTLLRGKPRQSRQAQQIGWTRVAALDVEGRAARPGDTPKGSAGDDPLTDATATFAHSYVIDP
jgi:hypothetical protein